MAAITLQTARTQLTTWIEASEILATHQSYKQGSVLLTRADLGKVMDMIKFWSNKVEELEAAERSGGRSRMYRFVPRDI